MKSLIKLTYAGILSLTALNAVALDVGGMKLGLGPKLSLNANKASVGDAAKSEMGYSWGLGVVSQLDLDPVVLELGLQYSERRFEYKDLLGIDGSYATTLKQFEIPFLTYYKFGISDTLALRAGAGAQLEIGMGDVKGDAGSVSYSDAGISKTAYSLLLDVGTDYKISELGSLAFDIRYALGLNDRSDSNGLFSDKFKTQYIEVSAAFLF